VLKRLKKKIRYSFGGIALYIFLLPIRTVPLSPLFSLAKGLGTLAYYFDRRHTRLALDNLKAALGREKSLKELKRIAKENYQYTTMGGFEMLRVLDFQGRYTNLISLEGGENLDRALEKEKGVIGFSCHLGNFILLIAKLISLGYPTSAIYKDPKDKIIAGFFHNIQKKMGMIRIPANPRRTVAKKSLESLHRREILYLQLDQDAGHHGVFVDFLGRPASTPLGPIIFAQRTGAPLVPMYIIREGRNKHRLIIEPEVPLVNTGDKEKDLITNTQRLTKVIEKYVRKYPSQWWWMHNRWKSKPPHSINNEQ
jgi:KDO2-lipid IV(A) lauroyltransferase